MEGLRAAALILAAGGSVRLGRPKQTLVWRGETLLDRSVRLALRAGLHPVVVVLGASAAAITAACDLREAWVVVNPRWREGMASSIVAGVELVAGFAEADGVVLLTCDMPRLEEGHLRALVTAGEGVIGSSYGEGRVGVPAFFGRERFADLLQLSGEAGARSLLGEAPAIPLAPEASEDIDTPEEAARLLAREVGGE